MQIFIFNHRGRGDTQRISERINCCIFPKVGKLFIIQLFIVLALFPQKLEAQQACQRIVSLAPTVTETLFELGLGSRLTGVTTFCDYPEQAKTISRLGSYFDTNIEKALALKTDLVIGLPESRTVLQKFAVRGTPILEVNNRSIEHILASFSEICEICGCQERARELELHLRAEIQQIERESAMRTHKKAAILVASSVSKENIEFYLSGDDGYYSSLLKVLNLSNVIRGNTFALPGASFESLIALQPEIIFSIEGKNSGFETIKKYLPSVKIIELKQDYAGKPGPRFIKLLKDMHSELQ